MGSLKGVRQPAKLKSSSLQMQLIPELRQGRIPCEGCPLNGKIKVPPFVPPDPVAIIVGVHPGPDEVEAQTPFVGLTSQDFRKELLAVGLPAERMILANLTRCRPDNDEGEYATWNPSFKKAVSHCASYLRADIGNKLPLLLLGRDAVEAFFGKDAKLTRYRGLWHVLPGGGRHVFATWHPAGIYRNLHDETVPKAVSKRRQKQFRTDLKRFSDRVLNREVHPEIQVFTYTDPADAENFLKQLAKSKGKWAFDIETYDAKQVPSRKFVATNPYHKDFRVRGVAIAWRHDRGAWIELASWDTPDGRKAASKLLSPAFESQAEKQAFNSPFDEAGLVFNKWVRRIRHLNRDGMRDLIIINAGGTIGFGLERAVVEVLGEPQYWGLDKGYIKKVRMHTIANSAVRDASRTLKLCNTLDELYYKHNEYIWPDEEED